MFNIQYTSVPHRNINNDKKQSFSAFTLIQLNSVADSVFEMKIVLYWNLTHLKSL